MELKKSKTVFGILLGAGIALITATVLIESFWDKSILDILMNFVMEGTYSFGQAGVFIGNTLVVISIGYLLYQSVRENAFERFFLKLSPLLFPFYILHWLLVMLFTHWTSIGYIFIYGVEVRVPPVDFPQYLIFGMIILVVSILIVMWKGFSISRWIMRVSDYTRWGGKKRRVREEKK